MRDEDEDEVRDEVFGEEPTRPMYTEGGMQFVPQVENNVSVYVAVLQDLVATAERRS